MTARVCPRCGAEVETLPRNPRIVTCWDCGVAFPVEHVEVTGDQRPFNERAEPVEPGGRGDETL